jgi:hypothetical protein
MICLFRGEVEEVEEVEMDLWAPHVKSRAGKVKRNELAKPM